MDIPRKRLMHNHAPQLHDILGMMESVYFYRSLTDTKSSLHHHISFSTHGCIDEENHRGNNPTYQRLHELKQTALLPRRTSQVNAIQYIADSSPARGRGNRITPTGIGEPAGGGWARLRMNTRARISPKHAR